MFIKPTATITVELKGEREVWLPDYGQRGRQGVYTAMAKSHKVTIYQITVSMDLVSDYHGLHGDAARVESVAKRAISCAHAKSVKGGAYGSDPIYGPDPQFPTTRKIVGFTDSTYVEVKGELEGKPPALPLLLAAKRVLADDGYVVEDGFYLTICDSCDAMQRVDEPQWLPPSWTEIKLGERDRRVFCATCSTSATQT